MAVNEYSDMVQVTAELKADLDKWKVIDNHLWQAYHDLVNNTQPGNDVTIAVITAFNQVRSILYDFTVAYHEACDDLADRAT